MKEQAIDSRGADGRKQGSNLGNMHIFKDYDLKKKKTLKKEGKKKTRTHT